MGKQRSFQQHNCSFLERNQKQQNEVIIEISILDLKDISFSGCKDLLILHIIAVKTHVKASCKESKTKII